MSDRVRFNIPPEIREKYTGKKCETCGSPLFDFDGRIVCGGCDLKRLKAEHNAQIPSESRLPEYYAEKNKKKEPPQDGKSKAYRD